MEKLKNTNWLYSNVDQSSIDETTKKTIEAVSDTTSSVLERASEDDVRGLQAYTIQKMDQYMPTGKDIDHYIQAVKCQRKTIRQPSEIPGCIVLPITVSYRAVWRVSSPSSQTNF